MKRTIATLVACALLAGCGGSQGDDKAAGNDATIAADWDATDACARLDKGVLGAALGDRVTETSLAFVHRSMGGGDASTSECTYALASGGKVTLMTRNSPIADNTPQVIAMTKKTTAETLGAFGGDKTVEDVPGLGKAAFFVPRLGQMNVFLDDARLVVLTLDTLPPDKAKRIAADLVGKI